MESKCCKIPGYYTNPFYEPDIPVLFLSQAYYTCNYDVIGLIGDDVIILLY